MSRIKHWQILLILAALLLATLACNLPSRVQDKQEEADLALRATMQALIFATPLPQPGLPAFTPPPLPPGATPFPGLQTGVPEVPGVPAPTVQPNYQALPGHTLYYVQAGDTLDTLVRRFGVEGWQVTSADNPSQTFGSETLLPVGLAVNIPDTVGETPYPGALLPDSEIIYSPSAAGFRAGEFAASAGGYLAGYSENVDGEWMSGGDIVERIAIETSINPRILLAFLELRSGWVRGQPSPGSDLTHPLGFNVGGYSGLYMELALAAKMLNMGYYDWRNGLTDSIQFTDGTSARLSPHLNAGTIALQYLFARSYDQSTWQALLYADPGFMQLYSGLFGDPWIRAASVEPLFAAEMAQPVMELPFPVGESWRFTSGPHPAWNTGTPPGALDFSPVTPEERCAVSSAWVTASTEGVVVRAAHGALVIDADGDGYEQTGWNVLYMHIAEKERIPVGVRVKINDPIGHPSCEGGRATGKHVHIARKYNGEWISADGPLPFILSGWETHNGEKSYQGTLTRGIDLVTANPGGTRETIISR